MISEPLREFLFNAVVGFQLCSFFCMFWKRPANANFKFKQKVVGDEATLEKPLKMECHAKLETDIDESDGRL